MDGLKLDLLLLVLNVLMLEVKHVLFQPINYQELIVYLDIFMYLQVLHVLNYQQMQMHVVVLLLLLDV